MKTKLQALRARSILKWAKDELENILDVEVELTFKEIKPTPKPKYVIKLVENTLKIPSNSLSYKSRGNIDIVNARVIAIRIIRDTYKYSLAKIGSYFCDRDHSTILNSLNVFNDWTVSNEHTKQVEDYFKCITALKEQDFHPVIYENLNKNVLCCY